MNVPVERPYLTSLGTIRGYSHVLARVETTDGATGFGYVVILPEVLVAEVLGATRELAPQLVGMDIFDVEAAWAKLARFGKWAGPGGILHWAIAPLDLALWDAAARSIGQPLWRMLGGYRDRVPAYVSDGFSVDRGLDELAENARAAADAGFRAVKVRLGRERTPAAEVRRVLAVREGAGPEMRVLADAITSWDTPTALRTGRLLAEAGVEWLEDPLPPADLDGLERLASSLDLAIAFGEYLHEPREFARVFERRAASVAIVDIGRIGGITPWRRVGSLAQAYGVRMCGHLLPEWHVHLLGAIPNGHIIEWAPRSQPILRDYPAIEDGAVVAPASPGSGLTLDDDALLRFTTV